MTPPINSVSPERLAQLKAEVSAIETNRRISMSAADRLDLISIFDELAARRAAITPVDGVTIKPLEWGDHDSLSIIAHTVLGPYLVEVINSPRVALWLPNMTGQARKMIEGFDSVEDAKAAAQADFNARIQACLTSPAAEPVAWERTETEIHPSVPKRIDLTRDPELAEMWRVHPNTHSMRPLFAHPAPSASREVTEADIERAAEAMWRAEVSEIGAARRAREAEYWADQSHETQGKWLRFARAALLAALPEREV